MANWRREGGIVEDGTLQRGEGALAADVEALCINVLAGSWLEGIHTAFVKFKSFKKKKFCSFAFQQTLFQTLSKFA